MSDPEPVKFLTVVESIITKDEPPQLTEAGVLEMIRAEILR